LIVLQKSLMIFRKKVPNNKKPLLILKIKKKTNFFDSLEENKSISLGKNKRIKNKV
jgi:hypothetical protein